jgi:HK97 family phage major capsid protein
MSISAKQAELQRILREAGELQSKMDTTGLTESEGKRAVELCSTAASIQAEVDQYNTIAGLAAKGREVGAPIMPGAKREQEAEVVSHGPAGYITPGEMFVRSEAYKRYVEAGMPLTDARIAASRDMVKGYAPVTAEQKAAYDAMDRKAVPTFASGVIEPTRLAGVNLSVQDDRLRLADVIDTGSTGSNSVEWLRLAYTRAADAVADSSDKPEAAAAYTLETATVRTQAVTIPVTEQMLADAPALITEVNGRLMYDLNKLLEEQMLYGAGSGQDFPGILNDSDVASIGDFGSGATADSLIDKIRRAMGYIRRDGFEPNAVVMDPLDATELAIKKGSDGHYLYHVFPAADGSQRVWSLAIVESNSMTETALASEPERNVLVGDFRRGATLWNREAISLAVGYVNAQFLKNQRTIRAERRAAFAVREPLAFRKILTHVASGAS